MKRTLANLSKLPDDVVDNLKLVLKGAKVSINETIPDNFEVIRSLPHGHVAVILETIKTLGLDKIISRKSSRNRNLIIGMIVARIINPKSKLATARGFNNKYQDIIKANRSESAKLKDRKKRNKLNLPVHSFRTLLEDLGTICLNTVECSLTTGKCIFSKITRPTSLQQEVLNLLGVSLVCTQ